MRRMWVVVCAVAVWMLAMGFLTQSTRAEAESASFQYLDRFESGTFNGDNGTDSYNGPWWEALDWGGHNNGFVTVESGGNCPTDRCAQIAGEPFPFLGTGLYRWADTEGASQVKIRFRYALDVNASTNGYVNVAAFDGATWHSVGTIRLVDHADDEDDDIHTKSITVSQHAHRDFMVGFFAHGDWDAVFSLDNVEVFGAWDQGSTTTTTTTLPVTTTTLPPIITTTTTTAPTTTTTTTTTTAPPVSTTTTAAPRSTTTTTLVPGTTTAVPTTTVAALPPTTVPPPTTVAVAAPQVPIEDDRRYNSKLALISANVGGEIMSLPAPEEEVVAPGPVTQIMASLTTTAITVRSHLLSAMALGLLIAIAAIWGLGKRESAG